METIRVKTHIVKPNGYPSDDARIHEFEGELLAEHTGFRGEASAYLTKREQITVIYESSLVNEKVLRVHSDFDDVAKSAQGEHPKYDWELIEKIAQEIDKELPPDQLDI